MFNLQLPIAIGTDHAGFDYKKILISFLQEKKFQIKDFGCFTKDAVDYPDVAHPLSKAVESGEYAFGILLCGSANGVAITANKHQQIRAAICWNEDVAKLSRQHNNANIICIPSRFVTEDISKKMVELFMQTSFEGGRHENRVNKISC